CNIVLVVSEGINDFSMWELMLTVDLLKNNIPDPSLLTSSTPEKDNKNDNQSGSEDYMADLCFVHASSSATPEVTDSSVAPSTKVEDLSSSQQDIFLLPLRSHDNSAKFEYGTYSSMLGKLRDQVLSRPLRPFSKNLTERDWLRSSAKIWDMVKRSPVASDYCKALQSSGLFRK
uniref:Uncharacterized protein n=1 Tax=Aegilops tauschii subsp. strangulata TaxID=200361 RepID=A0A453QFS3_AEGTS